jgi:hypothetical protein
MGWLIDAVTKIWDSVTGFIESAIETAKRIAQIVEVIGTIPEKIQAWGQLLPPGMLPLLLIGLSLIIVMAVLKLAGFGGDSE